MSQSAAKQVTCLPTEMRGASIAVSQFSMHDGNQLIFWRLAVMMATLAAEMPVTLQKG